MEGGKGGNSYWPGFVDALTNVVIAMIFVIVVLAIALSFAAQLMGKKVAEQMIAQARLAASAASAAGPPPAAAPPATSPVPDSSLAGRTHIAVAGRELASAPAGGSLQAARNVLQLDFAPTAVQLDAAATDALRAALAGTDARRARALIVATGPDMALSANQRAAYLRVMAVRNLLIEQGFPPEHLQVRIDTQAEAAGPTVNIAFVESP